MALADRDYMRPSSRAVRAARTGVWARLRFFLWRTWRRLVMGH